MDLGNSSLMDDAAVDGFRTVVDDPSFPVRLSAFHMGGGLAETVEPAEAIARLRVAVQHRQTPVRARQAGPGRVQGFTARLQPPGYLPDDRQGIWLIPPPVFADMFAAFHKAGLTVHVHCNGDDATELFLETVESTLAAHPRWDHRHTVTHSGVPISLHSDSPVTPLDALATASYASARTTPAGRVLGKQERISVPQALHAMTLGAAYMLKMDHEVGSLEAGKYADLAVLADDPFDRGPESLRDVEVRGSVVGGTHFPTGHTA